MIGEMVSHYRVVSRVGGSGMGVVYEAEDLELDRHVALKFLPPELAEDEEALERFRREARAASALNHPHICTIHEIGEHHGQPFLILELLSGETLDSRIARGALPIDEAIRFGTHLADALETAHGAGIVHRDINPANLFITERGDLKVLDFGLSKHEAAGSVEDATSAPTLRVSDGPLASPATTMGTVHYMSPEQVRAENLDARTDIFSAGVVIYQMATATLPFDGSSPGVVFAAILSAQPEPPSSINPEVTKAFEGVLGRALAKERNERYQSALGLMTDLGEMPISADSWTAAAPSISKSSAAPHTRRLWLALAVVGALAMGSAWVNFRPDTPPSTETTIPEAETARRVVVLPFESLGDPDNQYFASGVSEEITSRLASIAGLNVISRSTARRYAGTEKTLQEIGEELEATHVVAGSVQWVESGGTTRVLISPELIGVEGDSQLWGDTIDQEVEDIFEVQGMIAEQIAQSLGIELSDTQKEVLGAELTSNPQAYQAFLRGRAERMASLGDGSERAIGLFETAVRLDPEFAEAWAELSRSKSTAHRMGYITDPTLPEQVRFDADRAVALKPESAVTQAALGWYYYEIAFDYQRAAEIWELTAKRHPNDAQIAEALGVAYRRLGRLEDMLREFDRALDLDPNRPNLLLGQGTALGALRQWEEAAGRINSAIELAPELRVNYFYLADVIFASGGSIAEARKVLAQTPGGAPGAAEMWEWHWYERNYEAVLEALQQLPLDPWVLTRLAILHRRMGNEEEALAHFERAKDMVESPLQRSFDHVKMRERLGRSLLGLFTRSGEAITPEQAANMTVMAWAHAGLGNIEETRQLGDTMLTFESRDAFSRPQGLITGIAQAFAWAGDTDRAIDTIEEALSTSAGLGSGLWWGVSGPGFRLDPDWDELRGNPRFEALIARLEEGG